VLAQLESTFPEEIQVAYRHFPLLSIHDKAALATQAAEAAGLQGEFWAMHDLLYQTQRDWGGLTVDEFPDWLAEQAAELGLDVDQFNTDLVSAEIETIPQEAWEFGPEAEIPGTPYLLINGNPYGGPLDPDSLTAIIKLILLEDHQFDDCPPMDIDPLRDYVATLETEQGEIVLRFFPEEAPLAVNNFIFLASQGWYDGVTFHRVLPGTVAQAGDPSGTGFGSPGYAFDNEINPDFKFDRPGVLGMANAGPGSNGSQFFIALGAQPQWDGSYTIFGEVISGMEVVEALTPRNPQQGMNQPPGDMIKRVTIEER
jgi:cyclophilin family peptidyl-prolyl cis-trans isomerase